MNKENILDDIKKDWTRIFNYERWDDTVCRYFLTGVLDTSIRMVSDKEIQAVRNLISDWKDAALVAHDMTLDNIPRDVAETLRQNGFTKLPDKFRRGYVDASLQNIFHTFRHETGIKFSLNTQSQDLYSKMKESGLFLGSRFKLILCRNTLLDKLPYLNRISVYVTSLVVRSTLAEKQGMNQPMYRKGEYTRYVRNKILESLTEDELSSLSRTLKQSSQNCGVLGDDDIRSIVWLRNVTLPCGDKLMIHIKDGKREFSIKENPKVEILSLKSSKKWYSFSSFILRLKKMLAPNVEKVRPVSATKESVSSEPTKVLAVNGNKKGSGWGTIFDQPFSSLEEDKRVVEMSLGVIIPVMTEEIDSSACEMFRTWYGIIDDSKNCRYPRHSEEEIFWKGQNFISYPDKVFDEILKERLIASVQRFEIETGLHPNAKLATERTPGTITRFDSAFARALNDYRPVKGLSEIMTIDGIEKAARDRVSRIGMDFLNDKTKVTNETVASLLSTKMYGQLVQHLKEINYPLENLSVKDVTNLKRGQAIKLESGQTLIRVKGAGGFGIRIIQPTLEKTMSAENEM